MKLEFVELCGFRGFRDHARLDFPAGFTILNGRNGVGKSTVCDAVEFVLTGGIDKYRVEKAAKESLADYLWWRGEGTPEAYFVKVGFADDAGVPFVITRSRDAGPDRSEAEIERRLCIREAKPDAALEQICRTSIIRDEWISALSFDLTETARFDLVKTALGAVEGPNYLDKVTQVVSAADNNLKAAEESERDLRIVLDATLVELAEAQAEAQRSSDVASSMRVLQSELPDLPAEVGPRLTFARNAIIQRRQSAEVQMRALESAKSLAPELARISSNEFLKALEEAESLVTSLAEKKMSAEVDLRNAKEKFKNAKEKDAFTASLAALVQHGESLGLQHGHCPLCATAQSEQEFQAAISNVKVRLSELGKEAAAAQKEISLATTAFSEALRALDGAEKRLSDLKRELDGARDREAAIYRLGKRAGVQYVSADPLVIEREYRNYQVRLLGLERATVGLEASRAVDRVASLEAKVATIRQQIDRAASEASRFKRSASNARELDHAVKRTNAEIIDERLATISPLLNELYQRLRPHTEWRSIDYRIRGDVRRFLSLTVGKDLNPQFVFSSGQRRAAGLCFLLSVHLSRPWCDWKTLILDDPVQHIDDYRALNLVEVLAGLRQSGRQIICAVEDPALADLMCRRLRSTPEAPGRRFDLAVKSSGGTQVVRKLDIATMQTGVLRALAS